MNSSPYAAPAEEYYYHHERLSATATPSPRAANGGYYYAGGQTPARPATRAAYGHSRNVSSTAYEFATARPSPRYTSDGYYATANVSGSHSRNHSFSTRSSPPPRPHSVHPVAAASPSQSWSRRDHPSGSCFIFGRSSTPHGESDEDEILEVNGRTYIIPAESSSRRRRGSTSRAPPRFYYEADDGERGADYYVSKQGGYAFVVDSARDAAAAAPLYESSGRTRDQQQASATPRPQPVRRASTSMPVRPQTARPASSGAKKASASPNGGSASSSNATPKAPKASEADAKKHSIPPGYSLKNWDPTESPILLLGSVFDANSLGKWIYDWTVFAYGPTHPISEIAGDMWLLLIQLAGKIRRAEDVRPKVRTSDNRETMDEFLESGERLMQKLRKLLKICEEPMLKSAKKNASLGKAAGIEFVETLFGRDRVLDKTEKFMQGVRTFNLRFDANCDDIIKNPTL